MKSSNERSGRRALASLALAGLGVVSILGNAIALAWAPEGMGWPTTLLAIGVGALALLAAVLIWRHDDRARWALLAWGLVTVFGHWLIVSPLLRGVVWPGYLFVAVIVAIGFRALSASGSSEAVPEASIDG